MKTTDEIAYRGPHVKIIQSTENPELVVAQAAKLCYSASGVDAITEKLTEERIVSFIKKLAKAGHYSAFEHASFTFAIEGISRVLTHQLVRHRLASYSQQSQRYVKMRDFSFVTPPSFSMQTQWENLLCRYQNAMKSIGDLYTEMLDAGIEAEDARYLLPNACETKIVVTMNARELLHFFNLRCCHRAQWEIKSLADKMLKEVKKKAPNLFWHAGPGCVQGDCPEGPDFACGNISEVREAYERL